MNRMLQRRGIHIDEVSQLTRLAILGDSGMGALCYQPAWEAWQPQELHDLPVLIFSTNTNVASDDEFETYHSMWQAAKNRAAQEQEMKP